MAGFIQDKCNEGTRQQWHGRASLYVASFNGREHLKWSDKLVHKSYVLFWQHNVLSGEPCLISRFILWCFTSETNDVNSFVRAACAFLHLLILPKQFVHYKWVNGVNILWKQVSRIAEYCGLYWAYSTHGRNCEQSLWLSAQNILRNLPVAWWALSWVHS